jgi:hypothetical protein
LNEANGANTSDKNKKILETVAELLKTLDTSATSAERLKSNSSEKDNGYSADVLKLLAYSTAKGNMPPPSSSETHQDSSRSNQHNIYNIINPSPEQMDELLKNIKTPDNDSKSTAENSSCKKYKSSSYSSYTDDLYEDLKSEQKKQNGRNYAKKGVNTCETAHRSKNSLAEYVGKRNIDTLETSCARNSYFLNADDDMVLIPSMQWEVPQRQPPLCHGSCGDVQPLMTQTSLIGTLLNDASDTKIGSIMPSFIYKETF